MVAQATLTKQSNALLTKFISMWQERYDRKLVINRHIKKWGFQDMISDLGYPEAQEVVEFFFETDRPAHSVDVLLRNYDRIYQIIQDRKKDDAERIEIRRATAERVKKWEEMNGGNAGRESN